jgi:GNAT superfamily N-acetyltransferase
MITTRFLVYNEYPEYAEWMKSHDADSRHLYFGVGVSDLAIDQLTENIIKNKQDHYFLVAEDRGVWVGTIHIAVQNIDEVEFGVIVTRGRRRQGIADLLLAEAITWARNRGFRSLYMHCLTYNDAIKHICSKHGLEPKLNSTDSEVKIQLAAPTALTLGQEITNQIRNVYTLMLQHNITLFESIYG